MLFVYPCADIENIDNNEIIEYMKNIENRENRKIMRILIERYFRNVTLWQSAAPLQASTPENPSPPPPVTSGH